MEVGVVVEKLKDHRDVVWRARSCCERPTDELYRMRLCSVGVAGSEEGPRRQSPFQEHRKAADILESVPIQARTLGGGHLLW